MLDDEDPCQHALIEADGLEHAVIGVMLLDGRRDGVRANDERHHEQQAGERAHDRGSDDHHHHGVAGQRRRAEHSRRDRAPGRVVDDGAGQIRRLGPARARLVRQEHVHLDEPVRERPGRVDVDGLAAHGDGLVYGARKLFIGLERHLVALELHERGPHLRILDEPGDGERSGSRAHLERHRVADLQTGRGLQRKRHVRFAVPRRLRIVGEPGAVGREQLAGRAFAPCLVEHRQRRVFVGALPLPVVEQRGDVERAVGAHLSHLVEAFELPRRFIGEARRQVVRVHVAGSRLDQRLGLARVQIDVHAQSERECGSRQRHEEQQAEKRAFPAFDPCRHQRADECHDDRPLTRKAKTARHSPGLRAL